ENVIETFNLTKKYDRFIAVNNLNLHVEHGEVFGLLGPNGAGKTTTILMLLGLTDPTSGKVSVLGMDPSRKTLSVKSRVGYIPDTVGFYDELTARENLIYIAKLNGLSGNPAYQKIDEVLQRVGLHEEADHLVATFSRGMRQRLGVADVLIKQPQLIIMDEPTQGLDPEGAREFLDLIRDLKKEGITILLSSHLLHQVQAVCDRVGLFNKGRMVLEGSVTDLAKKVLGRAYRVILEVDGDKEMILNALQKVPGQVGVHAKDGKYFEVEAEHDIRPEVARVVVESGAKLLRLDVEAQSLDEIYARYFEEVKHASQN
ncbi:MAG: ABC transporter ATP-binding protein, partial [Anaerolineales bacterium]